jgi:hypothetical protein
MGDLEQWLLNAIQAGTAVGQLWLGLTGQRQQQAADWGRALEEVVGCVCRCRSPGGTLRDLESPVSAMNARPHRTRGLLRAGPAGAVTDREGDCRARGVQIRSCQSRRRMVGRSLGLTR